MTTNLLRQMVAIRQGGAVQRCHIIPHQGSYCNAKHQWGVAMLLLKLFPAEFPRLAAIALTHDVPEGWLGDIPATTKRFAPGLRAVVGAMEDRLQQSLGLPLESALDPDDAEILRSCDHLELYIWGKEQIAIGNLFAQPLIDQLEDFFKQRPFKNQIVHDFFMDLHWAKPKDFVAPQAGVIQNLVEGESYVR